MEALLVNPRKRRRKGTKSRRRAKRRSAAPRRKRRGTRVAVKAIRRRRRRNPFGFNVGGIIGQQVMPAATGAVGALVLDAAMPYIPLPASLSTGMARHAVRGGIALGLGILASRFVPSRHVQGAVVGALTVTLHGALKEFVQTNFPTVALGEYVSGLGYVNSGFPAGAPALTNDGSMGEYVSGNSDYVPSDGQYADY